MNIHPTTNRLPVILPPISGEPIKSSYKKKKKGQKWNSWFSEKIWWNKENERYYNHQR